MRLHRFYVSEPVGGRPEFNINSAEIVHQMRHVFRLKPGDLVKIFDGSGSDYECTIGDFKKGSVTVVIQSAERSRFMPARDVYLFAAIVKKDNFEWIVQKATELGVTRIVPVMADHSDKKSLNEERLRKIAIEASEQSCRGTVPIMEKIATLAEAVIRGESKGNADSARIAFHTEGALFQGQTLDKNEPVSIFIGPEGGWSPEEIAVFHKNKISVFCLGRQILRAETAAIAALSLIMFK